VNEKKTVKIEWVHVPSNKVPKLKQYLTPSEWLEMRYNLHVPTELGGSYAFAKDEDGNLWFIEWSPFGDECRYLKRLEEDVK